tara:strand:- start:549 stop:1628 length:1080 start_codon:yes stop_codon:yes gene_type:complete
MRLLLAVVAAVLVGLALYMTDGRQRLMAITAMESSNALTAENRRLRDSLAKSVKAATDARASADALQREIDQLRLAKPGGGSRALAADGPEPQRQWVKPIRVFKRKGEIPVVLQEEGQKIGVEVGVFKGGFSNWVLSNWPACTKYYMVDLWDAQANYRQMDNATEAKNLERMETARKNVARFGKKAELVRKSSTDAAKDFADGSVDFVYLDARHTYDAVWEDLEAWWPKVRAGGIMAGEDYMDADEVWRMTASCDFAGYGGGGFPWVGCQKWNLPYGGYFQCSPRPECKKLKLGSPEADAVQPPCGSDYSLQKDGTRRKDLKAVKGAVDEFGRQHGRQIQIAHRDEQRSFMWEAWMMRK